MRPCVRDNYTATAVASWIITMTAVYASVRSWGPLVQFENFDTNGHRLFGGMGLLGMAIATGLVAGSMHYLVNRRWGVKDRSNYSVGVELAEKERPKMKGMSLSDEEVPPAAPLPINEATGLMGHDGNASIFRVGNCHPLRLVYPSTPLKSAVWLPIIALAVFAFANLIKPDLFDTFAGNVPVSNNTFYNNCTWGNTTSCNSTTADAEICVSLFGHLMGLLTMVLGSMIAAVGGITLFHYARNRACPGNKMEVLDKSELLGDEQDNQYSEELVY